MVDEKLTPGGRWKAGNHLPKKNPGLMGRGEWVVGKSAF